MDQLTTLLYRAMKEEGLTAIEAFPARTFPRAKTPFITVQTAAAQTQEAGLYRYLGMLDGRELYGRRLLATLQCDIYSPTSAGGSACMQAAQQLAALFLRGVEGLDIVRLTIGGCAYDPDADCFTSRVCAEVRAYAYATANADGTAFEKFTLKGEIL